MNPYELIGVVAAICTVAAFLPQALHAIIHKKVNDLSLLTLTVQSIGYLLWAAYGFFISSPSLVVANIILFSLATITLGIKSRAANLKHSKKHL